MTLMINSIKGVTENAPKSPAAGTSEGAFGGVSLSGGTAVADTARGADGAGKSVKEVDSSVEFLPYTSSWEDRDGRLFAKWNKEYSGNNDPLPDGTTTANLSRFLSKRHAVVSSSLSTPSVNRRNKVIGDGETIK